jgi:A/G-specific adenine glycosylase
MPKEQELRAFAQAISNWGIKVKREMPWKGEKNPYYIWLSEIILQQTRVEQGLSYFLAFKLAFPSVHHLAEAHEEQVMKLWEGLGYYSRARNLHATAQYVSKTLNGKFPANYKELQQLKGVGPYTAAAIASFAYEEPKAVVDGNVVRVLARYFGIKKPFKSISDKKFFQTLADQLILAQTPSIYNQAIMDFGALQCTPKKVDCSKCILQNTCYAFKHNTQLELPIAKEKIKIKKRYFTYIIAIDNDKTWLKLQNENDIWQGLYQFPKIEHQENHSLDNEILKQAIQNLLQVEIINKTTISETYTQVLSHQKIYANFVQVYVKPAKELNFLCIDIKNLTKFAFPKIINVYLGSINHFNNDK